MRCDQMACLISPLVKQDGITPTGLGNVSVFCSHQPVPRSPMVYQPCIAVVAQGHKTGYLGNQQYDYHAGQYLLQTLPMPFECESFGDPQRPLLGMMIYIDLAILTELVRECPATTSRQAVTPMASVAIEPAMREALIRLLRCLQHPEHARAIGRERVKDVLFEALMGNQGQALRALIQDQGHYSRILQVLDGLHSNLQQVANVEQLAQQANMSISSFHQHFKQVTQTSPLQYLKRSRLIKAQSLLNQQRMNVSQTADAVGYSSISQFSRDYKRYFGINPLADRNSPLA